MILGTHVDELERSGVLGRPARLHVRALHSRELVLGPPKRARIRIGETSVQLGGDGGFSIDWRTFVDIVGRGDYEAPFAGARVLDVGAHKGYFGAYALAQARGLAHVDEHAGGVVHAVHAGPLRQGGDQDLRVKCGRGCAHSRLLPAALGNQHRQL